MSLKSEIGWVSLTLMGDVKGRNHFGAAGPGQLAGIIGILNTFY